MLKMSLDFPDDETYWRKQYADSVLSSASWVKSARDLVRSLYYLRGPVIGFFEAAADIDAVCGLPKEKDVHGVYLMISAYAIENLLKALIVRDTRPSLNESAPRLPSVVKGHDLNKLADTAGIATTDAGKELLARLAHHAVWAGRYPAPMGMEDLKPAALPGGELSHLRTRRGSDIRSVDAMLIHCFDRLNEAHGINESTRGYGDSLQPWERVVIQTGIRPW
ncbi:MAG: hypothetical protein HEQ37_01645 [Acidovorax sp.]|nr:hypothetical protein [Acidovorax sp.]